MTRLEGDRFALVAFEGEAYPLVPLTLDADAVGLFLETVEPGIVPAPGTSLGTGLAKGLDVFVDKGRRNKVLVLVSDGENLEGDVDEAIAKAKKEGVVVHTVGVGTAAGQPVPEFDADGRQTGYKRDASGAPVVSRLNMSTLEAIAGGTGGQTFRLTPADTRLSGLASAIEGMERKALAREWSYRRRERFQGPLAFGLACLTAGLLLPLPRLRRSSEVARGVAAVAALAVLGAGPPASAQTGASPPPSIPPAVSAAPPAASAAPPAPSTSARQGRRGGVLDEVLLRPRRLTREGRREYERGNHPQALRAFEGAAQARPKDPALRFNLADGLYKNGRYDEAATLFRALGSDPENPLAPAARFNLGNSLYRKQDYPGAVAAYRDALRLAPDDEDTRRNLELALRALKEQKEEQQRQQQRQKDQKGEKKGDKEQKSQSGKDQDAKDKKAGKEGQKDREQQGQRKADQKTAAGQGQKGPPPRPLTPEEREDKRFREETGMPKERAMQLLDALQQNEKAEQKRLLALERAKKKTDKDW